ncbi:MAG: ATP-binding cassette domain-containing protein [Oscillospiraceae bacterium]
MLLEANNISFKYPNTDKLVIENFSLSIKSDERVGLVAPSGFGKTTFCKIIAGYEKPDSGKILLDGKPLDEYKGYCPVQMIWQHPEQVINPHLKLKEVLVEGDIVEQRIIDGLGIENDWLNRYPTELSGGELQRFCIARALSGKTKFILADEISTMLDLITQSQIWNFTLSEVKARDIGLLVISHNEQLLDIVCTRKQKLKSKPPA